MSVRRLAILAMLVLGMAGCTFEPGTGFAELVEVSLVAALEPGVARDLGDDTLLTDEAYEVHLDLLTVELGKVALRELQGGSGGGGAFDPTSPPAEFSLCHGGHCHHDDGSLWSYAEIEAWLAGDSAEWVAVAELPIDLTADLLAGDRLSLDQVLPTPSLPLAELRVLTVDVGSLVVHGSVTAGPADGGLGEQVISLHVDLPLDTELSASLGLVVDRNVDPELSIDAALTVDGSLFDHIDFCTLADEGEVDLTDPVESAGAQLIENALLSAFSAAVRGSEE